MHDGSIAMCGISDKVSPGAVIKRQGIKRQDKSDAVDGRWNWCGASGTFDHLLKPEAHQSGTKANHES